MMVLDDRGCGRGCKLIEGVDDLCAQAYKPDGGANSLPNGFQAVT